MGQFIVLTHAAAAIALESTPMWWKRAKHNNEEPGVIKRKPIKSGMTVLVIPDAGNSKRMHLRSSWLVVLGLLGFCIGVGAVGAPVLLAGSVAGNVSLLAQNAKLELEKRDLARRLELQTNKVSALTTQTQQFGTRLRTLEGRLSLVETRAGTSKVVPASDRPGGGAQNFEIEDPFEMLKNFDAMLERSGDRLNSTFAPLDASLRREAAVPAGFPTPGRITSRFGSRFGPRTGRLERHTGWDIATNAGAAVRVTAPGVVEVAGWTTIGYGLHIVINHGYGYKTLYGHLSRLNTNVGRRVAPGDLIGFVGSTGNSTGPHLHYEVRIDNAPINPGPYLFKARPKFDNLEDLEIDAATTSKGQGN
jgi:murein DD-endopeptidase MepM/ murein hydrolase activator NlpD